MNGDNSKGCESMSSDFRKKNKAQKIEESAENIEPLIHGIQFASKSNEDEEEDTDKWLEKRLDELFNEDEPIEDAQVSDGSDEENNNFDISLEDEEESGLDNVEEYIKRTNLSEEQKEWIRSMPWDNTEVPKIDLEQAERKLKDSHYGMQELKQQIMEYITMQNHLGGEYGSVLLLVGPPGVGKTSIAKAIAEALNREFVKIPLNGVSAAFELNGSFASWKNAQPGLIAKAIKQAESFSPVILLDEIDKIGSAETYASASAALIEIMDTDRTEFVDQYLEIPLDLSKIIFIATANSTDTISPLLLDRMEILNLPGYTGEEKFQIARRYIIPNEMKTHKIDESMLNISDNAIKLIIEFLCKEPGTRQLTHIIKTICRKAIYSISTNKCSQYVIDENSVKSLIPSEVRIDANHIFDSEIGGVNALAVTGEGVGIVNPAEVCVVPGDGDVFFTGSLMEDIRECFEVAMSIIKINCDRWGFNPDIFDVKDVHVNSYYPSVKKTGYSIGLALFTALISAMLNRPVKDSVAVTGEITLRGKVMPVGGVREKITAAYYSGIKNVFIPYGNRYVLDDLADEIKKEVNIIPVSDVFEMIDRALI